MKAQHTAQKGIVSFMVTLIMMLVISLIVIGFSQTARRTSREALDTQLSSQAFYAAESGVNTVIQSIKAGNPAEADTSCKTGSYEAKQLNGDDVKATCILVNPTPTDIKVGASQTASVVIPIKSDDTITSLKFQWSPPEGGTATNATGCSTAGIFPDGSGACGFGLLRVDLMKTPTPVNPGTLSASTLTFYMQPVNSIASAASVSSFTSSPKGVVVGAACSTGLCTGTITLSGAAQGKDYSARVSTLYRNAQTVVLTANTGSVKFQGAQVVIDSTGRAQDVLRRVQARYPIGITSGGEAPYAVQSESSVCKQFTVAIGVEGGYSGSSSCP